MCASYSQGLIVSNSKEHCATSVQRSIHNFTIGVASVGVRRLCCGLVCAHTAASYDPGIQAAAWRLCWGTHARRRGGVKWTCVASAGQCSHAGSFCDTLSGSWLMAVPVSATVKFGCMTIPPRVPNCDEKIGHDPTTHRTSHTAFSYAFSLSSLTSRARETSAILSGHATFYQSACAHAAPRRFALPWAYATSPHAPLGASPVTLASPVAAASRRGLGRSVTRVEGGIVTVIAANIAAAPSGNHHRCAEATAPARHERPRMACTTRCACANATARAAASAELGL